MEKLWTTSEAATFLGISEEDVEHLVRDGTLTGYKLGGQFLRFRPGQVEALKGTSHVRPGAAKPLARRNRVWLEGVRDFLYFYDFYLVSASLLAAMAIYLIIVG